MSGPLGGPAPAPRFGPGARIGPYEIASALAVGALGEVYRARDPRFERDVALKVLPISLAKDEERLRRFEREARAIAALSHPGVIVVHDFGTHEGSPYLVTELLEGETLRERISAAPLEPRLALQLAAEVARGLAAAHERGILHRDLKPENVFLTRSGGVKLLDFGLAKVRGPLGVDTEADTLVEAQPHAGTGAARATVGYMAPEQVRAEEADARSDVFALGAILYEMLWRRRAFAGGSRVETMSAILREDPLGVAAPADVPPAARRLVQRCLEKQPDERFQSARDLGFALDAVAEGVPARAGRSRLAPVQALVVFALGALAALVAARALAPRPPPRITGVRPLLGGLARPAAGWATDGQRVYYSVDREGRYELWQAPLAGGDAARLQLPFAQALVLDASRAQSALLVVGWEGGLSEHEQRDQPLWIVRVPGGDTRNTGLLARAAAWSPDGERLAWSGGSSDYNETAAGAVFVARGDGSQPRELWRGDAAIPWIRWSPDGTRLRFGVFDRTAAEWWWLELPADGSSPPARVGRGERGSWSPDGRHFVYGQWASGAAGPRFNLYAGPGREGWRAPAPGQLTFGPFDLAGPVFTPDGGQLVAAGTLRRMELLRYDAAGARFERSGDAPGGFVDYAPDGQWVAWLDPASLTLWRSRRDGSGRLQLTVPPMAVGLFKWSPDSRRLLFVADRSGGREPRAIGVVGRDGGTIDTFADPNGNPAWDVCWRDADTVSWGNLRGNGASVWTMGLRSRRVERLPGSEGMMGAKCTADGRVLAAKAWSLGYWLYRPDSGRWEDLHQPSDLWYPTWARDGRTVYGLSLDDRAIYRFRPGEAGREKVTGLGALTPTAPWLDAWMGLDPEDRPLLLRGTGTADLFVLDYAAR